MQQIANTAFTLGAIGYSAATTLFLIDLARREPSPIALRWAPRVLVAAAVMHFGHVTIVSLLTRTCPVGSVHFALSLVGLAAVVGYLVLRRRESLNAIGALVSPTALAFLVIAEFVGTAPTSGSLNRTLLTVHVTFNLLGMAMFVLAATAGALYLVQERRLREKRVGVAAAKLPPLDVLDNTLHRLLLVGFPLLTLGLVTGAVFAARIAYGSGPEIARAALSYTTWLVVAGVLVLRRMAGWRGRRAAYGAILGTICILLVLALYLAMPSVGAGV